MCQQNKFSESKGKFRKASNCERVLEAAKVAIVINKRFYHFTETWLLGLWRVANSVLNKGKTAVPPLFNEPEVLSSASDKAKLFAKNFSKNSNLNDSGISLYLFFLLGLI